MAWPAAGSGIVVVTDGAVLGTVVVTDGVVLAGSVLVSNVWPQAPSASRAESFAALVATRASNYQVRMTVSWQVNRENLRNIGRLAADLGKAAINTRL